MTTRRLAALLLAFALPALQAHAGDKPDPEAWLADASTHLKAGNYSRAIKVLDRILAHYQDWHGKSAQKVYCSRGTGESLYYMAQAAAVKQDAIVIGPTWAEAHHMKGYALLELGDVEAARDSIEQAIALSPGNATYLAERAYTLQVERKWEESMAAYLEAEEAADFSPEETQAKETARALRGRGFALIELERFDEAQALYERSLALDPEDKIAANELEYIRQMTERK